MTVFSVLLPFSPARFEHVLPFASLVQHRSPYRLWQGQSLKLEPHQVFSYAAAAGFRIPVGTGVTLMPLRHPMEAALQARSLAAATGQPVIAGFGPGSAALQQSIHGRRYARPLAAVREYLTVVRALLSGAEIDHPGDYFSQQGGLLPLPGFPVTIGLGTLRPRMARLAGELADAAITWMTPLPYLTGEVMPAVAKGAAEAQRVTPQTVAMVPVALRGNDRDPVDLALAGCGQHLQLPHYQDMLRRAGVEVDEADIRASAGALVESQAFLYGEPAEIASHLDAYRTGGVDEVVVNMTGACALYGARSALVDLTTLFEKLPPPGDG